MAQEKPRATRARKTEDGEPGAAAETTTGARARKAPAKQAATEPVAGVVPAKRRTTKKAATKKAPTAVTKATTRRPRTSSAPVEPTREEIAQRAYLLWERGEPGDQTTHWFRAESELRAA